MDYHQVSSAGTNIKVLSQEGKAGTLYLRLEPKTIRPPSCPATCPGTAAGDPVGPLETSKTQVPPILFTPTKTRCT